MKISTFVVIALLASTSTIVAQENSNPKFIFRANSGTVTTTGPSTPTDPGTPETEVISASISGGTFTVGDNVNISGTVSGNSEPVVWTIASGSLGSLSLSSSGSISGVASASGTFSAVLNVANSKASTTANITLTVNAPIPPLNVAANGGEFFAIKGQAITPHTINVTGGTAPYTSEFNASDLPNGISVSGLTVSGTAGAGVAAVDYEPIITVRDSGGQSGASLFKIKVRDALTLAAATPQSIYRGINYTYGVSASGGQSPQIALANPVDAPGLSFNGNTLTGQISSVPNLNSATGIGSTTLQFVATDETGQTATQSRTFEIWDLPSFTVSGNTSVTAGTHATLTMTSKAAVGTATFTATNLPAGLSVSGNTIVGQVNSSVSGTINSTIILTDSQARTATQNVTFTIAPAILPFVVTTPPPTTNMNKNTTRTIVFTVSGGTGGYKKQGALPTPIYDVKFTGNQGSIELDARTALSTRTISFNIADSAGTVIPVSFTLTVTDPMGGL